MSTALRPGWADHIAPSPDDPPAPARKTFRRSNLDIKRSQLRGAHASSKSTKLEKVLGPVESDE